MPTRKGERQTGHRQSDGRIVPMKARSPKGISAGGKSRGETDIPPVSKPCGTNFKGKH